MGMIGTGGTGPGETAVFWHRRYARAFRLSVSRYSRRSIPSGMNSYRHVHNCIHL
jgi:hypothetical protein